MNNWNLVLDQERAIATVAERALQLRRAQENAWRAGEMLRRAFRGVEDARRRPQGHPAAVGRDGIVDVEGGLRLNLMVNHGSKQRLGVARRSSTYTRRESMRRSTIAGIVILCLGAFVLLRGVNFTSRRDVIKVGDVKVTTDEDKSIPPWAGWAAVAVGGVLIVAGLQKRA